ncbi:CaiB/BaiF CoA-transferase family protein [Flammeovirgaceae bacterium SG7u.111]|nr:CaiB/BaiF CoA-transferase family protein [Flammeovirgaceae bacterium SG7u.132]WPO37862.1 CaiB/BaiF CoA-transferase family protein [Flammeovirgaceae bacterium SG7u.111]
MSKPLDNILIVDLSQFLSGPSASLRLADLGARVIKIEKPEVGDICRSLYVSNLTIDSESSIFHAINRNKESYAADLKQEEDRKKVLKIIEKADVVMHNFRPGVIEKLGMDYDSVKAVNPSVVYADITGYGKEGPWKNKPGQDLLVQSLSGLTGLSGNADDGPVPVGLAIVDLLAGAHLAQGILACLVRKGINGEGGRVEVSMLESIMEFQFESVTTFYKDGGEPTLRTKSNNAHAYLGAPYGVYKTQDSFMALAMGQIPVLGKLLGCDALLQYEAFESWFTQRDEIKNTIAAHLLTGTTEKWLSILEPADIWCAKVLNWKELMDEEAFKVLEMVQDINLKSGTTFKTTRCPIRINDGLFFSSKGSPKLGEDNDALAAEFGL